MSDTIDIVQNCARCMGAHQNLEMKKLTIPVFEIGNQGRVIATHFAMCPTTQEPILVLKTMVLVSGTDEVKV